MNFKAKLTSAIEDNVHGGYEREPFFSCHSYEMKLHINLNEGSRRYAGYLGVYKHLMKSDWDAFLSWPSKKRFTLAFPDQHDDPKQRLNINAAIVPKEEKDFEMPTEPKNGSQGRHRFVLHSTLQTCHYIREDTVFIMIVIDS